MPKNKKPGQNLNNGNPSAPKPVEVTFALHAAEAQDVYICGDFNDWSAQAVRMIRPDAGSRWEKRLVLPPGRYEYKFVVDGAWMADPQSPKFIVNPFGTINSVLEVPA